MKSLLQHTDLAGLRAGKRNLQDRSDDHQSQVKQMVSLLRHCVISLHTAGNLLSLHLEAAHLLLYTCQTCAILCSLSGHLHVIRHMGVATSCVYQGFMSVANIERIWAAQNHEVAMHAVQMKEHLKGISSSLVLIDDIHLYVLKAEGPAVQHKRSDAMHASINKVCRWIACKAVHIVALIRLAKLQKCMHVSCCWAH